MDESGRRWFASSLRQLVGPDQLALSNIFGSLTEYFRRTVGVWREYEETTSGVGHVVVPHYAPFTPSAVFVTDVFDGSTGHDMGAVHIHSITKDDVDIHFLRANGQNRSSTLVKFYMLCLP
jgi:hypothetical protein